MLWLCLHFPTLALEVFTRGQASSEPLLVCDGQGRDRQVLLANSAAQKAGIVPGLRVSAAFALASQVSVIPRAIQAEQDALRSVAAWAGQFTSCVHLVEPQAVLLEVGGSLRLFNGLPSLLHQIDQGIADLGYTVWKGVAPTKLAATWLARAGEGSCITEPAQLTRALAALPLRVMNLPAESERRLNGMGITRLGDCLRLPRAGLAQRVGTGFVRELDQAKGLAPDPRVPFVPPSTFTSRLELPGAVAHVQGLVFGLNRLVVELCGWLHAHDAGVMSLPLQLVHTHAVVSRIEVCLVAPSRDPKHLVELFRERLAQRVLPEPVEALVLSVAKHQPLGTSNRELFSDRHPTALSSVAIIERLRARLGDANVQGLQALPDHRPERGQGSAFAVSAPSAESGGGPRPYWLLPEPVPLKVSGERPCLGGVLEVDGTAERIESGWWDGADVGRDYYVARNPIGECYWIFRELKPPHRWWLHGIFA